MKHFAKNSTRISARSTNETRHPKEDCINGSHNYKLYFSEMKIKFTSICRHLAFWEEVDKCPANRVGLTDCPVVCGGGWLLALDYRHPVVEPAIRSANNSRPEAHGLMNFLIFLATGIGHRGCANWRAAISWSMRAQTLIARVEARETLPRQDAPAPLSR
jgi:hypothetical protein